MRLTLDGREYTLLDERGDLVALTDGRQEQLAADRTSSEGLLAILCFAANLDEATRSPLASVFV